MGGDASDRLTAWKPGSGELIWTHERFLHRRLEGLTVWSGWVVAGDYEGQAHVMDPKTGQTVLRLPTDGSAMAAPLVASGKTLVAVTRRGGVYTWQAP